MAVHKDEDQDEDGGSDGDDDDNDDDDNEEKKTKLGTPRQILSRRTKNTRERWCARSEENDSSTSLESDSSRAIGYGITKRKRERGRSA